MYHFKADKHKYVFQIVVSDLILFQLQSKDVPKGIEPHLNWAISLCMLFRKLTVTIEESLILAKQFPNDMVPRDTF